MEELVLGWGSNGNEGDVDFEEIFIPNVLWIL